MTDSTAFREAFQEFRAMPYPDHPRMERLRDWNSLLLDLDGHVAGYATRVNDGRLAAWEVPDVDSLVLDAESLRRDLGDIRPEREEDAGLLDAYRTYVAALERLVRELASLAHRKDQ
ncbi:hypothetical protein ACFYZ3_02370 [Streptomyces sp. NPDC001599]|uniref:hypothetical protein n=1 Tax=Streptomyces sp. NPDC001599 TaxID=3364591 RepID=UPI0036BA9F5A